MTDQNRVEPQTTDEATKRTLQDIDRFEDEGGAGRKNTRDERPDFATEIVQPELPRPIQSAAEVRIAADPSQVIVTAGATAHCVQVHHRGIPELQSQAHSPSTRWGSSAGPVCAATMLPWPAGVLGWRPVMEPPICARVHRPSRSTRIRSVKKARSAGRQFASSPRV